MTKIQVRKQFTTKVNKDVFIDGLFSIWRRYKFESNSQPLSVVAFFRSSCFQYDEDTSSKAIHNCQSQIGLSRWVVFNMTKIQVRKQFTTTDWELPLQTSLFSIWRRYKFESNSQQLTQYQYQSYRCFQYDEDTSSKAIHNKSTIALIRSSVVFNMTKIQVRKQFTTAKPTKSFILCCFQYDEDTSSKAIHNLPFHRSKSALVVFNMTKIQVRKQFTTEVVSTSDATALFSIWRRYKFESNSQPDLCK